MSAALKLKGELFWGTNGLVEACLEAFADSAEPGIREDDAIAAWCRQERERFFPGAVVALDPLVETGAIRNRLALVVARSEELLKRNGGLSDAGVAWVMRELPRLASLITKDEPTEPTRRCRPDT